MSIREILPTPLAPTPAPAPAPAPAPTPAPAPAPAPAPGRGKRPWERFGPITLDFTEIDVGSHRVSITRVPAFASFQGVQVYPPFTLLDQIEYGEANGLSLPTAAVMDAAHAQGWYHPYQTGFYDPSAPASGPKGMNNDAVIVELGRRWQKARESGGYDGKRPIANTTKAWILDIAGVQKPGYAVNRGFYTAAPPGGLPPVQKKGTEHNASYTDLAQGGWFVRNEIDDGDDYREAAAKGAFGDPPVVWSQFVSAARGQKAMSGIIDDIHSGKIHAPDLSGVWEFIKKEWASLFGRHGDVAATVSGDELWVPAWPGNQLWTDADIRKLVSIADENGLNPADILLVHLSETGGGHPSRWNNPAGAAGMMQWIDSTARALGTSEAEIRGMDIPQQLDVLARHAAKYWRGRGVRDAADLYAINYTGGLCRGGVCSRAGSAAYDQNSALDMDHDQDVDRSDLIARLLQVQRRQLDPRVLGWREV